MVEGARAYIRARAWTEEELAAEIARIRDDASVDLEVLGFSGMELDRLLAAAGTDKTRILTANVYLADIGTFAQLNKAWDAWVADGNAPPRATIEARLASADFKVEIVVTAAV